jgi:hypothetical protein
LENNKEEEAENSASRSSYVNVYDNNGDFYYYPYKNVEDNKNTNSNVEKTTISKTFDEENDEILNDYVILKAQSNSAIFLDGARVVHGNMRYKPSYLPPLLSGHNHQYRINFDKDTNQWNLYDFENKELFNYQKSDVKLIVVWNSHCFTDEKQRYYYD